MCVRSSSLKELLSNRLLTIEEVSELTSLAVGTIYRLVSQKKIPVVRLSRRCIRFRLSALQDWFETMTEEPKARNK
jgi:excisionase family DNA binding protein